MAAQTNKEVFNPKHIFEYIKAIELKCTEKESNPIWLTENVELLTNYKINNVVVNQSLFGSTIVLTIDDGRKITLSSSCINEMCKHVNSKYSFDSISNALDKGNSGYDILFAVKDTKMLGFLLTSKGDCDYYKNIHAVHLVCASKTMQGLGSLLIGAYLYCISYIPGHNIGLLELMESFENASGFFSYSKMGFDIATHLKSFGCFMEENCMPMMALIDGDTRQHVIERLLAHKFTLGIGMSSCDLFVKTYGAGLPKEKYLEYAEPFLKEYYKRCKVLKAKYAIMKALKGQIPVYPVEIEKWKAMKALYELSLPSLKDNEISTHELYKIDQMIEQLQQLIEYHQPEPEEPEAKKRKITKFLSTRKGSRVARKGSRATRKGSPATRKGSRATRKGSRATRKGSRATRKGSRATRKGSRATRKNN